MKEGFQPKARGSWLKTLEKFAKRDASVPVDMLPFGTRASFLIQLTLLTKVEFVAFFVSRGGIRAKPCVRNQGPGFFDGSESLFETCRNSTFEKELKFALELNW